MRDPSPYLRSLADSTDNLKAFLLADQVFWTRGDMPSLSLGGVYWDRLQLSALRRDLDPSARRQFDQLESVVDRISNRWREAWERRALAEARARLNLWRGFLGDLDEGSPERGGYTQEVRNRLLAGALLDQAGGQSGSQTLRDQLRSLDTRLSGRFERGEFIWAPELAAALPESNYWYLYGQPQAA